MEKPTTIKGREENSFLKNWATITQNWQKYHLIHLEKSYEDYQKVKFLNQKSLERMKMKEKTF